MIGEINQQNIHLLLPSKISYLANWLQKDKGISLIDAIKLVYDSATYKQLEREDSKTWHLGPATLYYDLTHETQAVHQSCSQKTVTQ